MNKYQCILHMGPCPKCKTDALNVNLYRKDASHKFACVECVWVEDPDADLDDVEKIVDA